MHKFLFNIFQDVRVRSGVKDKYDAVIASGDTVPMKRWGQPGDVGRAVRSILAGDWPFTTGDAIYLDGGFHLPRL